MALHINGTHSSGTTTPLTPSDNPGCRIFIVFNVINTITHILLGIVTAVPLLFVAAGSFGTTFNQHIILCVIGYQMLMAQAIMTFSPANGWVQGLKYQEKKVVHWLLQIAGSALAIAGTLIRINDRRALTTPHGITGLTAMILTAISLLGGVVNLYALTLRLNPRIIKLCHAFFGTAAFILATVCLVLAFDKATFRSWTTDAGASWMIAFAVLGTAGSLVSAVGGMYKKVAG